MTNPTPEEIRLRNRVEKLETNAIERAARMRELQVYWENYIEELTVENKKLKERIDEFFECMEDLRIGFNNDVAEYYK